MGQEQLFVIFYRIYAFVYDYGFLISMPYVLYLIILNSSLILNLLESCLFLLLL